MRFLIRYHKTSGNNTYLTTDDTFSKKSGGKLQYFSNADCKIKLNTL